MKTIIKFAYEKSKISGKSKLHLARENLKSALLRVPTESELLTNLENHVLYYLNVFFPVAKVKLNRGGWFGKNWDEVERTVKKEPIIVVSAHVGCPEMAGKFFSRLGLRIKVFVEHKKSTFFKLLNTARELIGINLTSNIYDIIRFLKDRSPYKVAVFLSDRNIVGKGVTTEFLGKTSKLPYGPIKISEILGVKIFPFACLRKRMFPLPEYEIYFLEEVKSFDELVHALEDIVMLSPFEWNTFWDFSK